MEGNKKTATEDFDRRFDAGEDVSDLVDWSKGKPLHGGKRPGAGRKSAGRRPYTIRLKPEVHMSIQQKAKRRGMTMSEYIESQIGE